MALSTMYPGINNSPKTELSAAITAAATSITVDDSSVLPEAPNLAVIGSNYQAEVVIYSGKNGNILTGCVRGAGGTTARSWDEETVIARNFTLLDYKSICDNILDLESRKREKTTAVNLATEVTGTLGAGNGGTGQTSLAGVKTWLGLAALAYKALVNLASDVSGILGVGNGGTGINSNPSMLTNLGSTSAASVFAASPRPGVTGTLGVGNGGTGAATAAINRVFAGPGSGSTAAPSFRALVAADIPSLNASKITDGTFADARIPSLAASKITSGSFATDRIPALAASKITSGTFDAARIPTLAYSKISGATAIVQRPNYTISTTDPGAGSTLSNGAIYFVI